jgi:hypothetical protein
MGASYALIRQMSSTQTQTFEVPIQYQKFALDTAGSDNDRTGVDAKLKYFRRWMNSVLGVLSIGATGDLQWSKGKNFRYIGLNLPVNYMTDLPGIREFGIYNTATIDLIGQDYFQSTTSRRDLLAKVGLGLQKTIEQTWNVAVDVSQTKNLSTVESARYSKLLFSVQLSKSL